MIGRAEWFSRRKYGGWGLSVKTWQGWLYVIAVGGISFALLNVPFISESVRMPLTYGWLAIACLDILHIMATLKKDEMEVRIEALAERNASWAMIGALVIGVAYQTAQTAVSGNQQIDMFLIATLVAGVVAKAITNLWLERKGI